MIVVEVLPVDGLWHLSLEFNTDLIGIPRLSRQRLG